MYETMEIGDRIKYLRKVKGWSATGLARKADISQSHLRNIENNRHNPSIVVLKLICDSLNVSLEEFFKDSTVDSLRNDPLLERIYSLTDEQKDALLKFLDTMK